MVAGGCTRQTTKEKGVTASRNGGRVGRGRIGGKLAERVAGDGGAPPNGPAWKVRLVCR